MCSLDTHNFIPSCSVAARWMWKQKRGDNISPHSNMQGFELARRFSAPSPRRLWIARSLLSDLTATDTSLHSPCIASGR